MVASFYMYTGFLIDNVFVIIMLNYFLPDNVGEVGDGSFIALLSNYYSREVYNSDVVSKYSHEVVA